MTDTEEGKQEKAVPEIIKLVNANDVEGVEKLLLTGAAKIEETDANGMTPLQHAAYKGQTAMCKVLIDNGADINADSHDHKYSVLHFAALSGKLDTTQLILQSGGKTYHTNTLGRTASQMAAFVGFHEVVAMINNYLSLSTVEYYTSIRGLEKEPKLPPQVAKPLYNIIMQSNLHPVFVALSVDKSEVLKQNLGKAWRVLELMCEKEAKKPENVNEVLCMKFHYLYYILKTLEKELKKSNEDKDKENVESIPTSESGVTFEGLIKKWLKTRKHDGYEENLELHVRDAIKSFPYCEIPLFGQLMRVTSGKLGEGSAVESLSGMINGQRGFRDDAVCSTCGTENKEAKKCSKCKSVCYCNRTCQRLHWGAHKKFCPQLEAAYERRQKEEEERKKAESKHTSSEKPAPDKNSQDVSGTDEGTDLSAVS